MSGLSEFHGGEALSAEEPGVSEPRDFSTQEPPRLPHEGHLHFFHHLNFLIAVRAVGGVESVDGVELLVRVCVGIGVDEGVMERLLAVVLLEPVVSLAWHGSVIGWSVWGQADTPAQVCPGLIRLGLCERNEFHVRSSWPGG